VQLEGKMHLSYQIFQSKTGKIHVQFHMNAQGIQGEGMTSGDHYIANGVTHLVANSSGLPTKFNFGSNFHLIQTGTESDLHGHVVVHVSISASGALNVEVLEGSLDCGIDE
jgi:hypothetical protein